MNKKHLFLIWLVNTCLACLVLLLFIHNTGVVIWLVMSVIFSIIIFCSSLVLRYIFIKIDSAFIKFILTMLLAFVSSVLALYICFLVMPGKGDPISTILVNSFAVSVLANIAFFWVWGIFGAFNFVVYYFRFCDSPINE